MSLHKWQIEEIAAFDWKKSQKKIRRERRQRMAYKKGGGK